MSHPNTLKARVKAVNAANDYANKLYPQLVAIFEPLVGEQVLKADGTLLAKYQKLLPDFPSSNGLHVYKHSSDYSLAWCVKTCEQVEDHCTCVYHEVTVYIGSLSGKTLKEIDRPFEGKTDYTVADVQAARERYKEAKKAADEAKSALFPFGEYDH